MSLVFVVLGLLLASCSKESYDYPKTSSYDARMERLLTDPKECELSKIPVEFSESNLGVSSFTNKDEFNKLEKYLVSIKRKPTSYYDLRDEVIVGMETSPLKMKYYIRFMHDSCSIVPQYQTVALYLKAMIDLNLKMNQNRKALVKKVMKNIMETSENELGAQMVTAIVLSPNFLQFFKVSEEEQMRIKKQRLQTKKYLSKTDAIIAKLNRELEKVAPAYYAQDHQWDLKSYDKMPQEKMYQFNGLIIEQFQRQKKYEALLNKIIDPI